MGDFYPLSDPKSARTYWILHVRAETSKGASERRIPVTRDAIAALGSYREAFGMTSRPDQNETTALLLSPRTSKSARTNAGRPIKDVQSRRFFQAWRPVATRHGLYRIVKQRLADAADFLDTVGDAERARVLRQASTHWLRHTFAKAALLTGQDMRSVAAWLGHRDMGTTMVYTEQDALDLIRSAEQASPVLWSNLPGHLNRWKIHHLRSYTWQQESVRRLIPA
jgi:integrase/recombinase XerC